MVTSQFSVFLFIGEENYLKENALNKLKASFTGGTSSGLDYKVFYGGETSAREILDYATAYAFFSAEKLIVVKDFEKLPPQDRAQLADYIKKPSKSTFLVLDIKDTALVRELDCSAQHVKSLRFNRLTESEISPWIRQYVSSKSKKIDNNAVDILKELQGQNLSSLAQELEKLVLFVSERECIGADDVEKLVGKSNTSSAFDLAWAIGEKDLGNALKIISDLTLAGKRAHEIVGLLFWHVNRILRAKVLHLKGESASSVASALKISRKYQEQFFKQVRSVSLEQVKSDINILLEADLDIKRTRLDSRLILELVIIRLCLS